MIIILTLIFLTINQVLTQSSCRHDGDLLTDQLDCTRFFKCNGGIPYSLPCPAGLRFNPTLKACDWPEAVPCLTNRLPIQGLIFKTDVPTSSLISSGSRLSLPHSVSSSNGHISSSSEHRLQDSVENPETSSSSRNHHIPGQSISQESIPFNRDSASSGSDHFIVSGESSVSSQTDARLSGESHINSFPSSIGGRGSNVDINIGGSSVHFNDLNAIQTRTRGRLLPSNINIDQSGAGVRSQVLSQSGEILVKQRNIPAKAVFVSGTIRSSSSSSPVSSSSHGVPRGSSQI